MLADGTKFTQPFPATSSTPGLGAAPARRFRLRRPSAQTEPKVATEDRSQEPGGKALQRRRSVEELEKMPPPSHHRACRSGHQPVFQEMPMWSFRCAGLRQWTWENRTLRSKPTPIYVMDVKDAYLCVPQPESRAMARSLFCSGPGVPLQRPLRAGQATQGEGDPGKGADDMFATDATDLNPREATTYRTMLGKVLYMSNERPDAQAVIQNLSSRAAKPTAKAMKLIKHLVGYLWGTQGYGVTFAWPQASQ